jgi:senataxin
MAFHRDYDKPQWSRARHALRDLLDGVLLSDVQQMSSTITEACRLLGLIALKKPPNQISALSIRTGLWPKVYLSIHRQDPDGLARVLILASEVSHIDILNEGTFKSLSSATNIGKAYANGGAVITTINSALSAHRVGFLDAVRNFADLSTSSQLSDVLKHPKVGKAVLLLLLSPVDDLHTTAKTLVGQAFDVDGRLECIHALMDNLPDQSIDGLLEFLNRFCTYAPTVPEACSLSKSLVRCFTDVIEALCSGADGLLRSPQFLRCDDSQGPASRMIELWVLMSKAIAVIFKRTPAWSIYFDSEEMVEWMRDALIFGRDMLAQWQVIEGAANAFYRRQQGRSKGKASTAVDSLSETGQKMISCFQDVLTELTRWLRLTDEELLHQSFSLLQSLLDLFHKTGIRPCEAALSKLTKYADSARKDINQTRSRLDASRITALEEALTVYNDDDDIKIISEQAFKESYKPVKDKVKEKFSIHELTKRSESSLSLKKEAKAGEPDTLKRKQTQPTLTNYLNEKDKMKGDRNMATLSMPRKADNAFPSAAEKQVSSQRPREKGRYRNEAATAVDSESSSESDGSESDAPAGGLATFAKKFAKSPKIKKPVERKQIKFLETASMAEDIKMLRFKQREEAQRAKKRMRPDISGLHRTLLSWNYDHDGPMPPGFDTKLTPVPDVFMDLNHFHRVFEPLLMLECWAQIVQAKDEPQETLECKITSKQYVDEWLDLDIVYETNVRKDYYLVQETDVVLLRNPHTNEGIMAKTKSFTSNYQGVQASLRCYFKDGAGDPGLQISTSWKISKVFRYVTSTEKFA